MVAPIFLEGSGSDSDNLDDTDTKLYILGIEYKTSDSKLCEKKLYLFKLYNHEDRAERKWVSDNNSPIGIIYV